MNIKKFAYEIEKKKTCKSKKFKKKSKKKIIIALL